MNRILSFMGIIRSKMTGLRLTGTATVLEVSEQGDSILEYSAISCRELYPLFSRRRLKELRLNVANARCFIVDRQLKRQLFQDALISMGAIEDRMKGDILFFEGIDDFLFDLSRRSKADIIGLAFPCMAEDTGFIEQADEIMERSSNIIACEEDCDAAKEFFVIDIQPIDIGIPEGDNSFLRAGNIFLDRVK